MTVGHESTEDSSEDERQVDNCKEVITIGEHAVMYKKLP